MDSKVFGKYYSVSFARIAANGNGKGSQLGILCTLDRCKEIIKVGMKNHPAAIYALAVRISSRLITYTHFTCTLVHGKGHRLSKKFCSHLY